MPTIKPNIVFIYVDNHPGAISGYAGNSEIHTPNLDQLAKEATSFSNAYCPNTMCSPCRASVLTGKIPSQHGVHTWIDDDCSSDWPETWNAIAEFDTLPEQLSREGYDTALIGKYHLGDAKSAKDMFDEWVTMQIGHVQSFYENDILDGDKTYKHPGHSVDFFTDKAIEYLDRRSDEKETPFFLFLTYPAPYGHWPSIQGEPNNRYADLYKNTEMKTIPREGVSKEMIKWIQLVNEKGLEEDYSYMLQIPNDMPTLRNYFSQITMVDDGVGRVEKALKRNDLFKNTLFIYASDHGMSLGQHGFWGHGEDTWPSNAHHEAHYIPLIIKTPGGFNGEKGDVCNLVGTTDMYATILDYVGLEQPSKEDSPARSLRPLIENKTIDWDDVCFMEQEETRTIRTKKWLFMKRLDTTPYAFENELYDLESDPGERKNLISSPEMQDTIRKLSEQIDTYFSTYSNSKWDLWKGGTVKSNSTRPFLWKEHYGEEWKPGY
ncbi:MAG: sulfatase-like hydrolase/transferase [Desulfobacterales bacterium]|nr:sulfatase-like hydrolase/transferase [Desulfobacterales bacterium]